MLKEDRVSCDEGERVVSARDNGGTVDIAPAKIAKTTDGRICFYKSWTSLSYNPASWIKGAVKTG